MLDPDGVRLLACAMIHRALLDMRSRGEGGPITVRKLTYRAYVDGTIWLCSTKASIWFDLLDGVDQRDTLHATNWIEYASDVLMDPRAELRAKEVEVLVGTIDALETDRWMERYAIQS
jgi:hypothetical protein|tara:strand:+ start:1682 stop:2035 length:354 start_codon:yes stop_codon:yes gene_type:complete